jgi:hypothetical protein
MPKKKISKKATIKKAVSEINALEKVERFAEKTREEYENIKRNRDWLKALDVIVIIIILILIISAYTGNFLTLDFFLLLGTGILFYILIRLVASRK